jgi:hypothetical protein
MTWEQNPNFYPEDDVPEKQPDTTWMSERERYLQDQHDTPQMSWPQAASLLGLFALIGFILWLVLG